MTIVARKRAAVDRLVATYAEWNAANDIFADWRRQLDNGEDIVIPEFIGLLMSDMREYRQLMRRSLKAGYTIQRHPAEQHGTDGTTPMLVRK